MPFVQQKRRTVILSCVFGNYDNYQVGLAKTPVCMKWLFTSIDFADFSQRVAKLIFGWKEERRRCEDLQRLSDCVIDTGGPVNTGRRICQIESLIIWTMRKRERDSITGCSGKAQGVNRPGKTHSKKIKKIIIQLQWAVHRMKEAWLKEPCRRSFWEEPCTEMHQTFLCLW